MKPHETRFWNLVIWIAGRVADTGWYLTICGNALMEVARIIGFGAKARLESEGRQC